VSTIKTESELVVEALVEHLEAAAAAAAFIPFSSLPFAPLQLLFQPKNRFTFLFAKTRPKQRLFHSSIWEAKEMEEGLKSQVKGLN